MRRWHVAVDLRLAAYRPAGIARYALELLRALAAVADPAEWRFTALTAARLRARAIGPGAGEAPQPQLDLPPHVAQRSLLTPPHHPLEQWTLPPELLPLGIDLLHSPDVIPPFRRRCRSVITIHDLAFLRVPGVMTPASRRYYGGVRRAVCRADDVIVPSQATADDVAALLGGDPARRHVIPEAPAAHFRPAEAATRAAAASASSSASSWAR